MRTLSKVKGDAFRDEWSVRFDGGTEYAVSHFIPSYIGDGATFAMWIKMYDFSGSQRMGHHQSKRWYFGFSGTKAFFGCSSAYTTGGGITPNPALETDQWIHYCVSTSPNGDGTSTATLYLNGIEQGTLDHSSTSNLPEEEFYIGVEHGNSGASNTYMNCSISEIINYDIALTGSQVREIYNNREPYDHNNGSFAGTNRANIKHWWRMGDFIFDRLVHKSIGDASSFRLKQDNLTSNGTFDVGTSGWSDYSGGSPNTLAVQSGHLRIDFGAGNLGLVAISDALSPTGDNLTYLTADVMITSSYNGGDVYFTDASSFGTAFPGSWPTGATPENKVKADSSIVNIWQKTELVFLMGSDNTGNIYIETDGTDPSENDIIYVDNIEIHQIFGKSAILINHGDDSFERSSPSNG